MTRTPQGDDIRIPHSAETEAAILGNLMLDMRMLAVCDRMGVCVDDFFLPSHRAVFAAILANRAQHPDQFDPVSLITALKSRGDYDRVGGHAAVGMLLEGIPRYWHVSVFENHVRRLRELANRRALLHQAHRTENGIANGVSTSEVARDLQQLAQNVQAANNEPPISTRALVVAADQRLDERQYRVPRGSRSGFPELDLLTGGLQPGHMCVIGARSGIGKTTFALQWCLAEITADRAPLFLSLEMSAEEVIDRMLRIEGRLDGRVFATGMLSADQRGRYELAKEALMESRFRVRDRVRPTLEGVVAVAQHEMQTQSFDLLVLDYLGMLSGRGENRVQDLSTITRGLKLLSRDLGVPILCLAQLNRAIEGRNDKPRLSDLRESGSIEQDADQVIFIVQAKDRSGDFTEVTVTLEKNRHGRSGEVEMFFDRRMGGFVHRRISEGLNNE